MTRRSPTLGIAVAAVLCTWCAPATTTVAIPALTPLTYELSTDWSGAHREESTWVFETDRGYTVGIETLSIGVGVLELVVCPEVDEGETLSSAFGLLDALGPGSARADHSWDADASRATVQAAEVLSDDTRTYAGPASASGATYCELFWTIAPVEDPAFDGLESGRAALLVEGWLIEPGATEREPLMASVALGEGAVIPMEGPWVDGGRVRLTRYPARSFDGLDLAALSPSELAFAVVQRLGNTSRAEITVP